jgi:hypothetical protein
MTETVKAHHRKAVVAAWETHGAAYSDGGNLRIADFVNAYYENAMFSKPYASAVTSPAPVAASTTPRIVTTGWEALETRSLNQDVLIQALRQADPSMADFFEQEISAQGRVETVGQLIRMLPDYVRDAALTQLNGRPAHEVAEKALFELVATAKEAHTGSIDADQLLRARRTVAFTGVMKRAGGLGVEEAREAKSRPEAEELRDRKTAEGGRR